MQYLAALALAIGLATTLVPSASAQWVNQYGNEVFPTQAAGNGINVDGVIHNATPPAPVTLYSASASGDVAGNGMVCPLIGSCYNPPANIFFGGDRK